MTQKPRLSRPWRFRTARAISICIGAVFIGAAVAKAWDLDYFVRVLRLYGFVSSRHSLAVAAWCLVVIELGLGWALIVSYRPKVALALTAALLSLFVCAGAYAWLHGLTEDCGCFGKWVSRSPKHAVVDGALMLAATLFCRIVHAAPPGTLIRFRALSVWAVSAVGLLLPAMFGFSFSGADQGGLRPANMERIPHFLEGLAEVDLSRGLHLLVLIDTECGQCGESVAALNALAEDGELPNIIAFSRNDDDARSQFEDAFGPVFSVLKADEDTFWKMLGEGAVPRTILIRDGDVLRKWDLKVPDKRSVMEATRRTPDA